MIKFSQLTYHKGQEFVLEYNKPVKKFGNHMVAMFKVYYEDEEAVHFLVSTPDGETERVFSTREMLNNPESKVKVLWVKDKPDPLLDEELFSI